MPPNGAAAAVGLMSLMPTMPNWRASLTRVALARFVEMYSSGCAETSIPRSSSSARRVEAAATTSILVVLMSRPWSTR